MEYIETDLKNVRSFKYFTVYCIVDEVSDNFTIFRDHSSRIKINQVFNLKKEDKVRIFGHFVDNEIKIDNVIKVDGPSEYLHKKFLDLFNKLFKREE